MIFKNVQVIYGEILQTLLVRKGSAFHEHKETISS